MVSIPKADKKSQGKKPAILSSKPLAPHWAIPDGAPSKLFRWIVEQAAPDRYWIVGVSASSLARELGVSRAHLYRAVKVLERLRLIVWFGAPGAKCKSRIAIKNHRRVFRDVFRQKRWDNLKRASEGPKLNLSHHNKSYTYINNLKTASGCKGTLTKIKESTTLDYMGDAAHKVILIKGARFYREIMMKTRLALEEKDIPPTTSDTIEAVIGDTIAERSLHCARNVVGFVFNYLAKIIAMSKKLNPKRFWLWLKTFVATMGHWGRKACPDEPRLACRRPLRGEVVITSNIDILSTLGIQGGPKGGDLCAGGVQRYTEFPEGADNANAPPAQKVTNFPIDMGQVSFTGVGRWE